MMDQHMLCDDGFENVVANGQVTGFALLARLPYYRGLGLSMVEDIAVTVDGEPVPREAIRLELRGRSWSLAEMETCYDEKWNFGEKARVVVARPGGLTPGEHKIGLAERLRISYLPFVPTTQTSRVLRIAG
ncbi:C-glycoside deglycosidase beta subunit domain-containing protein [Ramlibacter sp. MAHUQ-53]|uniref:C-glycoside deglycosidase beta subunit domain-containing protein n=1 Tax=unclassified Ramlibacter TaxID=2617605 RepID=UPI00363DDF8E